MGGASEWSTVPAASVEPAAATAQPPLTPAAAAQEPAAAPEPAASYPLEPLPPVAVSAAAYPPPAPPSSGAQGYAPVYGTPGQQQSPPPPPGYTAGPSGYPPPGPPPPGPPPPGYGAPPPGYPPGPPGTPGYPPPRPPGQGLSSNAAAAISYITFIPAVIFLVMEPYNRDRFVRFHAWQCIALTIVAVALSIVFAVFTMIGLHLMFWMMVLIHMVVRLVLFVFWLIALIKASQGQWYRIPLVGDLAENFAGRQ